MRRVFYVAVGLAALAGCHRLPPAPSAPHTQVQVFNQCQQTLAVGDKTLEYWTSWPSYVVHGAVESIPLSDSAGSLGTLVITSLVNASAPDDRYAAVNLQSQPAGHVFAVEYSPDIDAVVANPRSEK